MSKSFMITTISGKLVICKSFFQSSLSFLESIKKIYQNCNVVLDNTPPSIGIGDYRMIASEPTNLEQHQNQRRWRPGGEEEPSLWSSTPSWVWYPGYLSDNKSPPPWCGQETPLINVDGTFGPHTGAPPQCLPFLMELLMETFSELISIGFVEAKNG